MLDDEIPFIGLSVGGGVIVAIGFTAFSYSPLGGAIALVIGFCALGTGLVGLFR